jgi:Cytochrome P460
MSAEEQAMKAALYGMAAIVALVIAMVGYRSSSAQEKQDKYKQQIPGGLAFSEIRGYEQWQVVGPSLTEAANVIRVIVANPEMIKAYQDGVPGNGKPFPDGSKIVKLEWRPKKITDPPFSANTPDTVPGDLAEVEFIVKDSKKFSDTHGWGYAMFDYDAASGTFAPATKASKPPVDHDARCGAACHELAASKDYIFTAYPKR